MVNKIAYLILIVDLNNKIILRKNNNQMLINFLNIRFLKKIYIIFLLICTIFV
jgi:hypothetical protein